MDIFHDRNLLGHLVRFLKDSDVLKLRLLSKQWNHLLQEKCNLFWAKLYYRCHDINQPAYAITEPIMQHRRPFRFLTRDFTFFEIPFFKCVADNITLEEVDDLMTKDCDFMNWTIEARGMLPIYLSK